MNYGNYPDLSQVKKILVIKLRHHGDVLLASPVFSMLKKALPDAEVDAYIYADTLAMLEGHPHISHFLLYDRSWKKLSLWARLKKEWSLLKTIRRSGYDLVINLTEGDRGGIAAWVSKAPIAVGYDPKGKGFFGKKNVYTHLVKPCPTPRHNVERNLDVLRRIGIFPEEQDKNLTLCYSPETAQKLREKLEAQGWNGKPFIVFHSVSRWRFKMLPQAKNAAIVRGLVQRGWDVVMTSSPDAIECRMVQEILAEIPSEQIMDLSGKTSLKELSALIHSAQALITVDSVPLHIASAFKTPLVVMFGPTSELNWGPWHHPRSAVVTKNIACRPCGLDGCGGSKKSDCLAQLDIEAIFKALEYALGKNSQEKIQRQSPNEIIFDFSEFSLRV